MKTKRIIVLLTALLISAWAMAQTADNKPKSTNAGQTSAQYQISNQFMIVHPPAINILIRNDHHLNIQEPREPICHSKYGCPPPHPDDPTGVKHYLKPTIESLRYQIKEGKKQ
jgi:hypothetical protein